MKASPWRREFELTGPDHRCRRGRIANCAAIGSLLVSWILVFKSGGIDIFRLLRSTWMSLTLTHGDNRRTSAGLRLVQIITWWSRDDHVTTNVEAWAEADNYPQTTASGCLHLKEQTWSSHAWHTEYQIKLASVADHRMLGPVQQIKRCTHIHRLHMTTSKKNFGTWISCFSLSVTTLTLSTLFHNLCTATGNNFWPLCFAHVQRHLQAILSPIYGLIYPMQVYNHGLIDWLFDWLIDWLIDRETDIVTPVPNGAENDSAPM